MKKYILSLLFVASLFSLSAQSIYPQAGENWKSAKPSKYGYDSQKLKEIKKYVIDSMNTTGLMVIVGGECIFKYGIIESVC